MAQTQRQYDFANGNKLQDFHLDDEFNTVVNAHNTLDNDVQGHKSSADHDGRYYTKTQTNEEINKAVVSGSQSKVVESGTVFPSSPVLGQKFFKTDEEQEYIFANGRWLLQETDLNPIEKEIANINLNLELNNLATSRLKGTGVTFLDGFNSSDYTNRLAQLDTTKTNTTASLSIGATTIPVVSATGFAVGQEVTIYDDVNLERVTISAINGLNLTVTALTKAFKNQANVARSMCVLDTTNKALKFGGWSTQTTNTVTDASVVASAYDTSGNGGRKLVRLDNGWLISVLSANSASPYKHYFYKSVDNGTTWTQICFMDNISNRTGSLSFKGNRVYFSFAYGDTTTAAMYFVSFDATTVTNTDLFSSKIQIDSGFNMGGFFGVTSIIEGSDYYISHSVKHTSYPNSANIRYAKGTINADGSVTWGAVEQRTTQNTTGYDLKNPTIVLVNGKPVIIHDTYTGSVYGIGGIRYDGTTWSAIGSGTAGIYNGSTYAQSSPSAIFVPQSVNGLANGLIGDVWDGFDATHTTTKYIRFSKSIDLGVNWSAMQKIVPGTNGTLTANKNGKLFITYEDAGVTKRIESTNNGDSWSAPITVGNGTNPSSLFDLTMDMSVPLTIRKGASSVLFNGTWIIGTETPILVNDVRYKLDTTTDDVVAWVKRDTGLTVSAHVSMVDSGNEVYTNMTQNADVSDEYEFTASATTNKVKNHLKLTMTRPDTNEKKITRLLGGVA